ncbi:hypothetical protein COU78_03750 [Candidatus Peregrinibacteria bacterium CG10_big_fil_rev_8_21_14_0_10_49_24]|nr:MAG: hypothetical protein COV83_05570 [Candidatus Peregrinibacteria bacterium CG11_big_fil_rev_8_21_14_0_20_49_14]PIR51231.1 MAG: hypothetical protein COU78_03750 [Candidatus Peregrinibacteria bacterium CG10_big_fil_rev_8_21_14_0_10_49_24]PJA67269.1 MAG: hypothetical protein CO157_05905 [Candidatus Peregrinibacteria bacterium CG_4_9_14_3_um_filter_49_12]
MNARAFTIVVAFLDAVLLVCSTAVMSVIVAMSVMMFDAPGSTESLQVWGLFTGIALFCTALVLFCLVRAVQSFRRGKYVRSVIISALPLLPFVILQILPL